MLPVSLLANERLIPMDNTQTNHLKAYGLIYNILKQGREVKLLLNYRGGSFLVPNDQSFLEEAILKKISWEVFTQKDSDNLLKKVEQENVNTLTIKEAPKIAIYKPKTSEPWDDAVTMVLDYSKIPYKQIWDTEVLQGDLNKYNWLHLHHEDFTGQYGKFFGFAKNAQWYQERRLKFERMAKKLGYREVKKLKLEIARTIQNYVADGGFLFAMCSATDTIDISLAAQKIDIVDALIDGTPITPRYNKLLNFNYTFAFQNFLVFTNPYEYEFSNIDIDLKVEQLKEETNFFSLFEFNAHLDPIPSLLTQNHQKEIRGFLGQTTAFRLDKIKARVLVLGQSLNSNRVKYLYGSYKKGFFSFYGGHDPEDYQHLVGDPPTNLALHRNSPGYRIILNNIFLPGVQKKKKKT